MKSLNLLLIGIKLKLNEIEVSTVVTEKHNVGNTESSNVIVNETKEIKKENEDFRVMKDEWFNKKLEESKKEQKNE